MIKKEPAKSMKKSTKKINKKGSMGKNSKPEQPVISGSVGDGDKKIKVGTINFRNFCDLDDMDDSFSSSIDTGHDHDNVMSLDNNDNFNSDDISDYLSKSYWEGVEMNRKNSGFNDTTDNANNGDQKYEIHNNSHSNVDGNNKIDRSRALDDVDDAEIDNGEGLEDFLMFTDINDGDKVDKGKDIDIEPQKSKSMDGNSLENLIKNTGVGNPDLTEINCNGNNGLLDPNSNANKINCNESDIENNGKSDPSSDSIPVTINKALLHLDDPGLLILPSYPLVLTPILQSHPLLHMGPMLPSLLHSSTLLPTPQSHLSQSCTLPLGESNMDPLGSIDPSTIIPTPPIPTPTSTMENCELPQIQTMFDSIISPDSLCRSKEMNTKTSHICHKCNYFIPSDSSSDLSINCVENDLNHCNPQHSNGVNSSIDDGCKSSSRDLSTALPLPIDRRSPEVRYSNVKNNEVSYSSSSGDSVDREEDKHLNVVNLDLKDSDTGLNTDR